MRLLYGLTVLVGVLATLKCADALLAAMSIDLGSEYLKIALVKPGVPMEIVLNRESKRKTRSMLSIRDLDREFGDNAMSVAFRHPKKAYMHFVELLGKKFEHPSVQRFQKWFPHHKLVADHNRGTVLFEEDSGATFSPEELVAMLLADCKDMAESYAEQPVRDVVITVPAFWNQAERRALANAAEIAGLNLLQLMNDNTAAGVNYGMFRRKEFNETATRVAIYDMGSIKTTATIFEYKIVQDKVTKEKNPEMAVLGVGYDRTLGGIECTMIFRESLAAEFVKQHGKKSKTDIHENPKAMLKLLKEAERVKQVLSANVDHFAQVEGLHEDIDFRAKVTREELDGMCAAVYDRVPGPLNDALKMAEIGLEHIDYVVLMGAGTRSLKVQEKLQAVVKGKDLGKYLNTDEAVAMGAVYQAAHRSKGFKVKKFIVKDINLFPIQVDFQKEKNASVVAEVPARIIHRTLFGLKNHFPQKKVMTFNKHTQDFEFNINYGDLSHLNKDQLDFFGQLNLTRADLHEIATTLTKHESAEFKGIKAHFRMDDGGILTLDGAEAVFEQAGKSDDAESGDSTLSKIGKKLSNLFGGGNEEKPEEKEKTDKTEEKKDEKTAEKPDKKKETTDKKQTEEKPTEKNETVKNETGSSNATKSESTKPKTVKIPLKLEQSCMDLPNMTSEAIKAAGERLSTFQKYEKARREREKAHNTLEAFVFDTTHNLEQEAFKLVSTLAEREVIQKKLKEVSEWLEEQGVETATKFFEERLKSLKDATKDLFYRHDEAKERPRAAEALKQMLNYSSVFLAGMKNLTEDMQIFTESEITTLEKLISTTEKWWNDTSLEQGKLAPHEKPVITLSAVAEKLAALDREVKYLLNKAKFTKPKGKSTTSEKNDTSNDEKSKTETDDQTAKEATDEKAETADDDDIVEAVPEQESVSDEKPADDDKHIEL